MYCIHYCFITLNPICLVSLFISILASALGATFTTLFVCFFLQGSLAKRTISSKITTMIQIKFIAKMQIR